jgi:acetyl-CoA carboxylase biotin carboxyl carrier protein
LTSGLGFDKVQAARGGHTIWGGPPRGRLPAEEGRIRGSGAGFPREEAASAVAETFARPQRRPLPASLLVRDVPEDERMPEVVSPLTGSVWKIEVSVGDRVSEGDTVVVLESMKMEIPVESEMAGEVAEIPIREGETVNEGETLVVLR